MTSSTNERLYALRRNIADLLHHARKDNCSYEDLFGAFAETAVTTKIKAHQNGTLVEKIQAIEKEAIEHIKDVHISEHGRHGKKDLKVLGLYGGDPDTLGTFPCFAEIQEIVDLHNSNMYHIFITRGNYVGQILYDLRHKYYIPIEKDHWQQMYFPFEEGLTINDLANTGKKEDKKMVKEPPMIITFAHKSRMTLEQLTSAFIPDPKEAEERHTVTGRGDLSMYIFLGDRDRLGLTWVNKLNACVSDAFNDPLHACPSGPINQDVVDRDEVNN
jgi:hypothetical protein